MTNQNLRFISLSCTSVAAAHRLKSCCTLRMISSSILGFFVNPVTPVPPVTARDEPWPFFLFWRHRFWPKLASSILNFCSRKRSFQWCPDQSDRLNEALDMHKNAKKVEWKTWSKISCHYTWMLHAKNYPSWWRFLRSQSLQQKHEKRRKRKGEKKFQKSKSLKM